MAYTVYNFDVLIGGGTRALDAISVGDLSDGDRALGMVDGRLIPMRFNASITDAEDIANHPFKVRPDDYSTAGVWIEQILEGIPIVGGNLIINPQFEIDQEVITPGTHSADEYFRDQWKAGDSGCTVSLSGDTLTISAGSVIQPIENVNIPNGTYTLSWEGTAQAYIDGGAAQSSPHTFTVSSGTHVEIEFGTGTLRQPVLVPGACPAKFFRIDDEYDFSRCRRFWRKSYRRDVAPGSAPDYIGSGLDFESFAHAVIRRTVFIGEPMREVPAITLYSTDDGSSGYVYAGSNKAVSSISYIGVASFHSINVASIGASVIATFHWTADARL